MECKFDQSRGERLLANILVYLRDKIPWTFYLATIM